MIKWLKKLFQKDRQIILAGEYKHTQKTEDSL